MKNNFQEELEILDLDEMENNKIRDIEEYRKKVKKIAEKAKKESIKPGVKIPNTRRKKEVSKMQIAIGMGIAGICFSFLTPVAAKEYEQNHVLSTALEAYQKDIIEPNTSFSIAHNNSGHYTPVHKHHETTILERLKEEYENPIIIFYLFYQKLMQDEQCRIHYKQVWMQVYNNVNNTDYTNLEDFLKKNNFNNYEELKEYVALELQQKEIRKGR